MATVALIEYADASPEVRAVFDYCIHSHTAAAHAKGMTDAQHAELLAVIGMASQTNALSTALKVPVDPQFLVEAGR
jgi:alkylhydroperoxidase family enzyme